LELKIMKLDVGLDLPKYIHDYDAAFDLPAAESATIAPGEKKIIRTGLKMAIPEGYTGLIWDRSGLAAKNSVHVLAGVIDSGYRGEVGVVLINLGKETITVEKNMRIAQMLIQPVAQPDIVEVKTLNQTSRNEGGFGSTGM